MADTAKNRIIGIHQDTGETLGTQDRERARANAVLPSQVEERVAMSLVASRDPPPLVSMTGNGKSVSM